MKKLSTILCTLALLFIGVGGAKAENAKLASTGFSGFNDNCKYDDLNGKFCWWATTSCTAQVLSFEAGALSKFSKIKYSCSDLTEGCEFRFIVVTSDGNYQKEVSATGNNLEINLSDLHKQWGSTMITSELIASATELRIGGNTVKGTPSSESPITLTIDPTSISLEADWEVLSIADASDWIAFSKLVASGVSPLDAQLTADIDAGSTMVGAEDGKEYSGTFDGAGHTLSFNYEGSSDKVAPFKAVNGATIKDLITTGSILSSNNLLAGIIGQNNGATSLIRCASHMSVTTTIGSNGRIGGLVARNANTGSSLTFTNCMYDGAINSSTNQAAGFVGWSPNATTISNCLVASTSITGGENNFSSYSCTIPDGKYALYINKFGASNQGASVSEGQLSSGYVAYTLNSDITEGTLFFGQDLKSVSSRPLLTGNVAYKVFDLGGGDYANWTNTIGDGTDWATFSKIVANGSDPLNVTMTADVNAGSTMVGSSEHQYSGTFDGNGHKLTVAYTSTTPCAAPFSYVSDAIIKNLIVDGSIESSSTLIGGVVGQMNGTTIIDNCKSSVDITSTLASGDCNCGGIAGINIANSTITVTNCLFDGTITANGANAYCGIIGYLRDGTLVVNNNLVLGTLTGAANSYLENIYRTYATHTASANYYKNQFGSSSNGTSATDAQLASGEIAYNLQGEQSTQYWGQGYLNSSRVENYPSLTSDATKKVYKAANESLYANADGLLPDPALSGKLAWKMEMTYDPLYFSSLPAASASSFNLYGTSDAYLLTVGSAGATTLVLPYDIASLPAGVKAYDLTFDGSTITAIRVYSITADKPVLINAEAGNYIFSTGIDWGTNIDYSKDHASTTNGALTGVYNTSMPFSYVPANAYVLQNGDDGLGFYQVEEANTIKITSFRAYLTAPTTSRSLKIVYADESTDIKEMKNSGSDELKSEEYYNLSGQRISKPTKGLYIVNGKKVAIK